MGCGGSKGGFEIVVLREPTSRPLESLQNEKDAEGILGHTTRIASDTGGRFFFGASSSDADTVFLESTEFDHETAVEVGRGGFGAVYASLHKPTGAIVAIKRVRKSTDSRFRKEIEMEASALTRLQGCPFVVRFYGCTELKSHQCFVLQLLQGGELYSHLRRTPGRKFAEAVARFYAAELVTCLEGVHGRGMAFRDLKPENLCLDADGHIALIDFGFCCHVDEKGLARGHVGTPYFMSPEILDPRSKETGYPAQAVDWWAMGCAVWEMLAGKHPFGHPRMTKHEVFIKITHGTIRPPVSISSAARSFLSSILHLDYKQRLKTAASIKEHPWLRDIPWEAVAERRVRPPWVPTLSSAADCRYFPSARGRMPALPEGGHAVEEHPRSPGRAGDAAKVVAGDGADRTPSKRQLAARRRGADASLRRVPGGSASSMRSKLPPSCAPSKSVPAVIGSAAAAAGMASTSIVSASRRQLVVAGGVGAAAGSRRALPAGAASLRSMQAGSKADAGSLAQRRGARRRASLSKKSLRKAT